MKNNKFKSETKNQQQFAISETLIAIGPHMVHTNV